MSLPPHRNITPKIIKNFSGQLDFSPAFQIWLDRLISSLSSTTSIAARGRIVGNYQAGKKTRVLGRYSKQRSCKSSARYSRSVTKVMAARYK